MSITSRLSMLDDFGGRRQIIPAEVSGRFRRWRNYVHFILLLIFLGLPWLQINGTQALLFDIPGRRFEFFGLIFLSHDSPLVFFIFALLALTIMLTTALWGRVWCGWACPQTVFIDAVFRRIEYLVEGNYLERRRLYHSAMTAEKFIKHLIKWVLFFFFSSLFAHSFIAYFSGSRRLLGMMSGTPHENWSYFLIVSGVTAIVLFNFGWFREQFCIIMCPYGRFQSVLMDPQSFSIVYDQNRGEPRKGFTSERHSPGDCVSCQRCVQVCPTGIDIRNGLQMECIGCTACIDACDEIMTKVNKPKGLISYNMNVPHAELRYFRPRILVYLFLIFICSTGLTYNFLNRASFSVVALRATDSPYQISPDGLIVNHFKINLHNQSHKIQSFKISLPSEDPPSADSVTKNIKLTQAIGTHELTAGESREVHLFISFPATELNPMGTATLRLQIHELSSKESRIIEVTGLGPYSPGQ